MRTTGLLLCYVTQKVILKSSAHKKIPLKCCTLPVSVPVTDVEFLQVEVKLLTQGHSWSHSSGSSKLEQNPNQQVLFFGKLVLLYGNGSFVPGCLAASGVKDNARTRTPIENNESAALTFFRFPSYTTGVLWKERTCCVTFCWMSYINSALWGNVYF